MYKTTPPGIKCSPDLVCKLKKFLYGLKQASRQWFTKLTFELKKQGFSQSKYDLSLFIRHNNASVTLAAVHVDGIILTDDNPTITHALKEHLHKFFSIKDLG